MAKEEKENKEGWDEKSEVEEGAKTKSEDEKLERAMGWWGSSKEEEGCEVEVKG